MAFAGTIHDPAEHTPECDWQFEQYPWDCNCGAKERLGWRPNQRADRAEQPK